jgi:hypothetical protein
LLPSRFFRSLANILVIKSWASADTEKPCRSYSGQRIGAF